MVNWFKKFLKELKRVRWISGKETTRTFCMVMVFITISSVVLFGMSVGFIALWDSLELGAVN